MESGQTQDSIVRFTTLNILNTRSNRTENSNDMFQISVPYPTAKLNLKYRVGDQGHGTMLVRMYPEAEHHNTTIITATDAMGVKDGYASLLHYLMYGVDPDPSTYPTNSTYYFVAKCEFQSIKYRDNYRSSWRKVDFTLRNGVSRANVTEERCPNPRVV